MRRQVLLSGIIILLFVNILQAQISKGSLLLGGGIGFSSNSTESGINKSTQRSFYVNPAMGVAVKTNLIVGGDLSYSYFKNLQSSFDESKYRNYGVGIFIRKYFPVSGKFYLFGQARAGVNLIDNMNKGIPDYSMSEKGWGLNFGVVPGISFAVSKKLHIESGFNNILFAGYQHTNKETITIAGSTKSKQNSFSVGSDLSNFSSSLYFGFRVLLGK